MKFLLRILLFGLITLLSVNIIKSLPLNRVLREAKFKVSELKDGLNLGGLYYSVCMVNASQECPVSQDLGESAIAKPEKKDDFSWLLASFDLCNLAHFVMGYSELTSVKRTQLEKFTKNQHNVASLTKEYFKLPDFCDVKKTRKVNSTEGRDNMSFCDAKRIFCSRLDGTFNNQQ